MARLPRLSWVVAMGLLAGTSALQARAQISLSTAIDLALRNSPRVKIAQTDLARAQAVLSETKDVFVPAVSANAGVGRQYGAPLAPPVVFSVGASSLVFNFAQPDYIRAAHSGLLAAQLALNVARTDVSEDTTNYYIALDNAVERRTVQTEALGFATRLVEIVEDRYSAGVDPHIEVTRARRTAAQLRLQELFVEDEIAINVEHLSNLTGLPHTGFQTVHDSVPPLVAPSAAKAAADDDPSRYTGLSAAFASARSREYTAHGDKRYLLRPQMSFSANYSRLSDAFSSYDFYYPYFRQRMDGELNSFNSLSLSVQLSVPIVDMVHHARARQAAADAAHAFYDAKIQQINFAEGRLRLRHSTEELAERAEIAKLDHDLAQDDLDTMRIRLRATAGEAGGPQSNPKDEQNALLNERQRQIDMLSTELQLHQAEVSLLRQEGSLANWLGATLPAATSAPGNATPSTQPSLAPTIGAEPGSTSPGGTLPGTAPTTGTPPATLPSSPVTTPSPTPAPSTPPSTPHS